MMRLLNLIHLMKIHTRIVHLSCNYFEIISHYGPAMPPMPMNQIHLKKINNHFIYFFFSFSVCVQHTHIQLVTNQIDKTIKYKRIETFFLTFNSSTNCASLYFLFVRQCQLFLYLSLSICMRVLVTIIFFLFSCLFSFFLLVQLFI